MQWLKNLRDQGLPFVERNENPPNAPQIRPIENFWGMLKQAVYDGNWSAKSRDHLIRRIKSCLAKFDMSIVAGMFDRLKDKIHKANDEGLSSVL